VHDGIARMISDQPKRHSRRRRSSSQRRRDLVLDVCVTLRLSDGVWLALMCRVFEASDARAAETRPRAWGTPTVLPPRLVCARAASAPWFGHPRCHRSSPSSSLSDDELVNMINLTSCDNCEKALRHSNDAGDKHWRSRRTCSYRTGCLGEGRGGWDEASSALMGRRIDDPVLAPINRPI